MAKEPTGARVARPTRIEALKSKLLSVVYPLAKGSAMMDKLKAVKAIMSRVKGMFSFQAFTLNVCEFKFSIESFRSNLSDSR